MSTVGWHPWLRRPPKGARPGREGQHAALITTRGNPIPVDQAPNPRASRKKRAVISACRRPTGSPGLKASGGGNSRLTS